MQLDDYLYAGFSFFLDPAPTMTHQEIRVAVYDTYK